MQGTDCLERSKFQRIESRVIEIYSFYYIWNKITKIQCPNLKYFEGILNRYVEVSYKRGLYMELVLFPAQPFFIDM